MSELLKSLSQKKQMFIDQMKQAEITYQQLTGAVHVVEGMIKTEEESLELKRLEKEASEQQISSSNEQENNHDQTHD